MATKIKAVKHEQGELVAFQIEDGRVFSKEDLIQKIQSNELEVLNVSVSSRNGSQYLRGVNNGEKSDNLDSLPELK